MDRILYREGWMSTRLPASRMLSRRWLQLRSGALLGLLQDFSDAGQACTVSGGVLVFRFQQGVEYMAHNLLATAATVEGPW